MNTARTRRDHAHDRASSAPANRSSRRESAPDRSSIPVRWQQSHGNQAIQRIAASVVRSRVTVGPPDDRYEREADRVAAAVLDNPGPEPTLGPGGTTLVSPGRGGVVRRQERSGEATPPPTQERDAGPDLDPHTGPRPGRETASEQESGVRGAPETCLPTALSRAAYLATPGTSTDDLGLTTLDTSKVTYPEFRVTGHQGGYRVERTTAALPTIPSVYTGPGRFVEGEAVVPGSECGRTRFPLRWTITRGGAARIAAGEREHCADFQYAFDTTLQRYADAANTLAGRGRRFPSERAAERVVTRQVGVSPSSWGGVFRCMAAKTVDRDRAGWHDPRQRTLPPSYRRNDCRYADALVTERSLPQVGRHPPSRVVTGCLPDEAGTATTRESESEVRPRPRPRSRPTARPRGQAARPRLRTGDTPRVQRLCSRCRRRLERGLPLECPACEATIRRRETDGAAHAVDAGPAVARGLRASVGDGRPLPAATRAFFEARFGVDFGGVRIHDDARAAGLNDALHARAFTYGREVYFGRGEFDPETTEGRRLLAHELTHVVQQGGAGGSRVQRQPRPPGDRRQYSEDCSQYVGGAPGVDQCEFYRCRAANNAYRCGASGYYLGYGLKYCERFNRLTMGQLSPAGRRWLERTTVCLQRFLDRDVPDDAPCDVVKARAFDSHPDCYVRSGICSLGPSDWLAIVGTIDSADNDLRQTIVSGVSCLFNWLPMAFPVHSLSAGGGYGGLMERDRQRLLRELRRGRGGPRAEEGR